MPPALAFVLANVNATRTTVANFIFPLPSYLASREPVEHPIWTLALTGQSFIRIRADGLVSDRH